MKDIITGVVLGAIIATLIALSISMLIGCDEPDNCKPEVMRCNGNTVEICNADKYWQEVQICSEEDICCAFKESGDDLAACLPDDICKEM